ncbi:beta-aspartyl-peptidase [Corallincola holothuriorum]|uniref:Isoaspartyl dipeptidase n=1 Tax=Corallincola holothuriorum TaxID=2282215 RepID=A0A368NH69_9GAMM|nr:beta-aspartyl-peptidase [Corallincola holothuriorum]RCU49912.1 beta-aspartyl-peptidase [Corallincola holothuriorum]
MLTLIKQAELFTPTPLGTKDLLMGGGKIVAIEDEIKISSNLAVNIIDGSGFILTPGFVDSLVHITGGGGEGGFTTRTQEMALTEATTAGVTTIVGALGTDAITRTLPNLLAKVNELNQLGISAYCYTGSYQFPVKTLLTTVQEDILLLSNVIGVGEVAIADHRASHITCQELIRLASEARVGGMLAGKSGIVSIHLGDALEGLELLQQAVSQSNIPASQFYPTHINRSEHLFQQGLAWAKQGGFIDFTTSTTAQILAAGEVSAAQALARALQADVPLRQITFSSDGNASLPLFDEKGHLVDLQQAQVCSLHRSFCEAINEHGVAIGDALSCVTQNPADILHLWHKGRIAVDLDADLVLMDKQSLQISDVWAQGQRMVEQGKAMVTGNFE